MVPAHAGGEVRTGAAASGRWRWDPVGVVRVKGGAHRAAPFPPPHPCHWRPASGYLLWQTGGSVAHRWHRVGPQAQCGMDPPPSLLAPALEPHTSFERPVPLDQALVGCRIRRRAKYMCTWGARRGWGCRVVVGVVCRLWSVFPTMPRIGRQIDGPSLSPLLLTQETTFLAPLARQPGIPAVF